MPDFGAPVAAGVQAQNPNQGLQTLSDLIGMQRQQQALQIGAQQLQVGEGAAQQAQQQMSERQLMQKSFLSGKDPDGNSLKGPDGQFDPVAVNNFASKYMPLTGQDVTQNIIKTLDSRVKLNDSVRGLNQNYRNDISGIVRSGIGQQDPATSVNSGLDAYAKQNPDAAPAIAHAKSLINGANAANPNASPQQRDMALQKLAMEFQPASTTAAEQNPTMTSVTGPGGVYQPVQVNPLSAVPMGATGPATQEGLSVSEAATRVPTMQGNQPGTVPLGSITPGEPGYNNGSPFGNGRVGAQPGQNSNFVASGAPMGTGTDTDWMKKDYQDVVAQAATAAQRIGLYDNVEQLSKKALTGPQDRLNYANSLLALIKVPAAVDANDAEAALKKNSAMIQNAFGGNTNMAREVVAHMTPGSVMPDKVNQEISEYGKANAQMQQFQQNYLRQTSNGSDAAPYKDRKSDLSIVSDPRLWQFQNATPAKRIEMLNDMAAAGQNVQQFGALYKKANAMGAFQ